MLDLRRLKSPARPVGEEEDHPPARPVKNPDQRPDPWHGRKTAPPPPGSDYVDFLDWATDGGPEWPGAVDLAIRLWVGTARPVDSAEAGSPAPRP